MQWDKLAGMQGWRVRLDPVPGRATQSGVVVFHDYDWIVRHVEKGRSVEVDAPIGYFAPLGSDHIREFISEPSCETDGFRHGVLILKVQLIYEGCNLRVTFLRSMQTWLR